VSPTQTHVLAGSVALVLPAGVAENHPEYIREFWSQEFWTSLRVATLSYYRPLYVLYLGRGITNKSQFDSGCMGD
jgi:hypothetical protein